MTFRKSFDVYDFYDRAKSGEKITQDDWDLMVLPSKTMELKQKYGLDFKGEFVPTEPPEFDDEPIDIPEVPEEAK